MIISFLDSPGIPLSANAPDLFRGFSFVAPVLINEMKNTSSMETISATLNNMNVSATSSLTHHQNKKPTSNDNNNNSIKALNRNINDNKKTSSIVDNLLRISIIKTIPFENEYTIKEVIFLFEAHSRVLLKYSLCDVFRKSIQDRFQYVTSVCIRKQ